MKSYKYYHPTTADTDLGKALDDMNRAAAEIRAERPKHKATLVISNETMICIRVDTAQAAAYYLAILASANHPTPADLRSAIDELEAALLGR